VWADLNVRPGAIEGDPSSALKGLPHVCQRQERPLFHKVPRVIDDINENLVALANDDQTTLVFEGRPRQRPLAEPIRSPSTISRTFFGFTP